MTGVTDSSADWKQQLNSSLFKHQVLYIQVGGNARIPGIHGGFGKAGSLHLHSSPHVPLPARLLLTENPSSHTQHAKLLALRVPGFRVQDEIYVRKQTVATK